MLHELETFISSSVGAVWIDMYVEPTIPVGAGPEVPLAEHPQTPESPVLTRKLPTCGKFVITIHHLRTMEDLVVDFVHFSG